MVAVRRRRSPVVFDELRHYYEAETEAVYDDADADREAFLDIILGYKHMVDHLLLAYEDCVGTLMHVLDGITPEDMKSRKVFDIAQLLEASIDRCMRQEKEHAARYRGHEHEIEARVDARLAEQFR